MRIGINCLTVLNPDSGEKAGVGHYTHYIVKHLLKLDKKNEYVLFFDNRLPKAIIDEVVGEAKNARKELLPFYQYKKYMPVVYSHMLMASFFRKQNLDLYFSPGNYIPLYYNRPSIITIHDLAIYKNPKWFPSQLGAGQIFSTQVLVPKSIKKAIKIIAPSENTKKDIIEIFKTPATRVKVIYEGSEVDPQDKEPLLSIEELKKKYKIGDRYIFYVGTIEPRKNILGLMTAFYNLKKAGKIEDCQLVLAGEKGWKFEDKFKKMEQYNKELNMSKKSKETAIQYIGYVSHRDKISLLKHSDCFVFPSFYEGFGLPIIEAMKCKTPVITSRTSSMPEIAGEAAYYIDPHDMKSIEKGIEKVLEDKNLRERLVQAGTEQARKFTWEKCAHETLDLFEEMKNEIIK